MEKKQWAIKVMDNKTQTGWLVVKHATVATYKSKAEAEREAEWLNNFAKKIKSKAEYIPARWSCEEGLQSEIQIPDQESHTKNSTRTMSVEERKKETILKSSTQESSVATTATLEELIGNMVMGGTA
jgi:hypothetical protein